MTLALITGASSGVGAATAIAMAGQGTKVILVARSAGKLAQIAEQIGPLATAVPCDAANGDAVLALSADIIATHGVPDVIIHCAGAGQWKTVQDTSPAEALAMMQAPYLAAFNITHGFLSQMLSRGSGVIIHVNSPACIAPWASSAGYAASRAALHSFHKALSQDIAGTGVQSCHVIFGEISSEYFENNPGVHEKLPRIAKTIPVITPQACATILATLTRHPRRSVIHPWILRLHLAFGVVTPRFAAWLLRL